jgi:hypothetical protein
MVVTALQTPTYFSPVGVRAFPGMPARPGTENIIHNGKRSLLRRSRVGRVQSETLIPALADRMDSASQGRLSIVAIPVLRRQWCPMRECITC